MTTGYLFDLGPAQSQFCPNVTSPVPPGIPLSAIWMRNLTEPGLAGEEQWVSPRALSVRDSGKFSAELAFGLAMNAAGKIVAIHKCARSSTKIADWLPGAALHADMHDRWAAQMTTFLSELPSLYPGVTFEIWAVPWIGESDSFNTSDANAFANNLQAVIAARQAVIGRPYDGIVGMLTRADSGTGVNSLTERAYQRALYRSGWVDWDDLAVQGDGVHVTGPTANTIGSPRLSGVVLNAIRAKADMGTLGSSARSKQIDHVRNVAPYTPAATHYLHLYLDAGCTVPATSGTNPGYAVASRTNNTGTWAAFTSRTTVGKANAGAFTFPTPTGTGSNILGWKLTDSPTEGAGTVLGIDSHSAIIWTVAGGPVSYAAAAITITAPTNIGTGGLSDTVLAEVMDLMFGGTANTARTTVNGSWYVGDPAAGGTIAGSSVSITQASKWGAASGGVAVTTADITLTQQVTGTWYAEHSGTNGSGSLLFSCPRTNPLTGSDGIIHAGQLQTSLV